MDLGTIATIISVVWIAVIIVINLIEFFQIEHFWTKLKNKSFSTYEVKILKRAAYVLGIVVFIAVLVILLVTKA